MKENFTQGDWAVSGDDCCAVFSGLELVVDCDISSLNGGEDVYNAMLIAAAPEMYRMLSEISAFLSFKPDDENLHGLKGDIEKLLAKARGEDA